MQRLFMLFGFATLILGAGLLAGQRVQSTEASDSALAAPHAGISPQDVCAVPAMCFDNGPEMELQTLHVPQPDSAIQPVSHQKSLEEDFRNEASSIDAQKAETIRSLIVRHFPEASQESIDVWTDVYASMDPAEVEFILEQKRATSGTLDSQIPGIMISPAAATGQTVSDGTATDSTERLDAESTDSRSIKIVEQNLNNAWSAGFRRTVVLLDSVSGSATDSMNGSAEPAATMFTNFDSGRLISSPMPLHVAIQDNPNCMFRLEGDLLTRRGDFQLLPDRRIGLMISGSAHALMNSPVIPENARRPSISAAGHIEYTDASDATVQAGQLEIAKITELDQLKSADGVFFTLDSSKPLQTVNATEAHLAIGTLELSNVDRAEETALLNRLRAR